MRIFISYQTEDEKPAKEVEKQLQSRGHDVMLYKNLKDPIDEITDRLRKIDLFILIVGHNTYKSTWVPFELGGAEQNKLPIIVILLDEKSRAPDTLRSKYGILAYPALLKTNWLFFDNIPSRKMQIDRLKKMKKKIGIYREPGKETIPNPYINRKSVLNTTVLLLGIIIALSSYIIGFALPLILSILMDLFNGMNMNQAASQPVSRELWIMFIIWQVPYFFILFYKPKERLAYPLRIFWFFMYYIPVWFSTRKSNLTKILNDIMVKLSDSPGNRAYWQAEEARRRGEDGNVSDFQHTKNLFELIVKDERLVSPYGSLDEYERNLILSMLDREPGFVKGEIKMKELPSGDVVINNIRGSSGQDIIIRKINDNWKIIDK